MDFELVRREHILQGIKDYEEQGYPPGFGPSSTYDVIFKGKKFPPKAVMAYANNHASGRKIERYFKGGLNTECFKVLREQGFKIVAKTDHMEIVNVKQNFAEWLLENAPVSYNQYLGDSTQSVVERLDEISAFFPLQDFFTINPNAIDTKVREIKFVFSTKERRNNPEFLEYDKFHSNGIPKAVMGKNNYIKFLNEIFGDNSKVNYWIFQGSPNIYDIAGALKNDHLISWKVSAHKNKIKKGDKVIIWQTGDKSGCYALAEVTSDVSVFDESSVEVDYYLNPQQSGPSERVKINVTKNLVDSPILSSQIKDLFEFKNFNAGNQGTNFQATKEEYEALLKFTENKMFTWVKTHKEIVAYLKDKEDSQVELINLLKSIGIGPFDNDEDAQGNKVDLTEIDPFTFFFFIYKYGPERRLKFLQELAKKLNVFVPNDELGIPSAQAQKLWLFPYIGSRNNNEINKLWGLFYSALEESITDRQFQDVLTIRSTGKTKLTEGLFEINPERYFPINGPTKPYLKEVLNIDPNFTSFEEYESILSQIKGKTNKPFYQLSYEAWGWNNSQDEDLKDFEESINSNSQEDLRFYFDYLDELVDELGLTKSDKKIVYSCKGKYFNFNIGQRIAWRLDKNNKRNGKFHIITDEEINENSSLFGGDPKHYYHVFNEQDDLVKLKSSFYRAVNIELARTSKSGYKRHNNKYFEKAVFDKAFRQKYINTGMKITNNKPINRIFFGPPGTGKTYFLKNQLFDKYTLKEEAISKEKYFEEVVANITWWQAITLALVEEGVSKVSNILENRWVAKKASLSESKNVRATIWGTLQMHTIEGSKSVNYKQRQPPLIFDKNEDKSWVLIDAELKEQAPEILEIQNEVDNFQSNMGKMIKLYDFVTFHQSFSYEDFIEGIKPVFTENDEEASDIGYTIEDGVFKRLCLRANNDPENRYAIFIDEINRGNVSAIFGELITLIEPDKRGGAENQMFIKLPYSKKEFSVPSNLDIYGTMNTADRSVEALDTALRRRFEFKEMMPNYDVISEEIVDDVKLKDVLEIINKRIELLVDRDHTIGHSYFVNVDSKKKLADAFNNKIVPLLQEYFYGDYGKIGLVLGKGFVEKTKSKDVKFAEFDYENSSDFKTPTFILKKVDKTSVMDAVKTLLRLDEKQDND